MLKQLLAALLLPAAFGAMPLAAIGAEPIEISKSALQGVSVPSLRITAMEGDGAVNAAVTRYLGCCGWFRLVRGGESDYTLAVRSAHDSVTMTLSFSGNVVYNKVLRMNGDARRLAARAVDELLEARFRKRLCDSRIVFAAETRPSVREIFVCDIDGGNLRKATDYSTSCVEPGWMPDAESVVYTRYTYAGTDICQTMLDPWRSRRITTFPGMNVGAAVHPGGNFLALVMSADRQVELYVKALHGRERRRLTNSKAVEASPCWSPDGGTICFVSDQSGAPRLYTIPANGGAVRQLPTVGSEAVTPDWSSDNKIVYSARIGGSYRLAVLDMNGRDTGAVPNLPAGEWESPSWAPDGRHVAASRRIGRRTELYVVDTKTGSARKLLNFQFNQSSPDWSRIRK